MFNTSTAISESVLEADCDRIAQELANNGWCVAEDFIDARLRARLAGELSDRWQAGNFHRAGIGRGEQYQVNSEVRSDHVLWLDSTEDSSAVREYLQGLEQLRLAINRELFLGLFEYEGHMAIYPPGSLYRKHLDQFRGTEQRAVTCILYLNANWQVDDGGELRIYTDSERPDLHTDILPSDGRLVAFLSARFPHEVLPARRNRMSITGWFKTRA